MPAMRCANPPPLWAEFFPLVPLSISLSVSLASYCDDALLGTRPLQGLGLGRGNWLPLFSVTSLFNGRGNFGRDRRGNYG